MKFEPCFEKSFSIAGGDFVKAAVVSSKVKKILQEFHVPSLAIRRAIIAAYEDEMNVVW